MFLSRLEIAYLILHASHQLFAHYKYRTTLDWEKYLFLILCSAIPCSVEVLNLISLGTSPVHVPDPILAHKCHLNLRSGNDQHSKIQSLGPY